MRIHRSWYRIFLVILFIISFVAAIAYPQYGNSSARAKASISSIPTIAYQVGKQQVSAPDWSQIAWSTLPPIEESGWIQIPANLVAQLKYDPSRSWKAGQTPDFFTMLGDVEDAFHMEKFQLQDISRLTDLAINTLQLDDFGLMRWQSVASLVEAIPNLGDAIVSQVEPIRDLFVKAGLGYTNASIAQVLQQYPELSQLSFTQLDLTRYALKSIPGLVQTPLEKFSAWQQSFIAQVPGLSQVPFSQFPQSPFNAIGMVGITDVVWEAAEHGDSQVGENYFISGSINKHNETEAVACAAGESCPYIELSDLGGASGLLHGKRWASGKQKVRGGFGPLAAVNNGREPTGRLVYGSAFKVVLTGTNESKGTADFGLYLRVCIHIPFVGKSCTPYFIGPIPWLPTREKDLVIVNAMPAI